MSLQVNFENVIKKAFVTKREAQNENKKHDMLFACDREFIFERLFYGRGCPD
jgi:hypothetical protein